MTHKQKRRSRELSIVVPLSTPEKTETCQRNKKLFHLLRWLRYGLQVGGGNTYYFIAPEDAPQSMPNGAYCLRVQLQQKLEDFFMNMRLVNFITRMKAETIAPVVYFFEHKTNGVDVALTPVVIYGALPDELPQSIPMDGKLVDLAHVPYFARQGLIVMINKPVDEF